jgi:sugar phosphate isomerase/epimerase
MKLGFFPTGRLRDLDLAAFIHWGAEAGFQAFDVPPDREGVAALARQHGLTVVATYGMFGQPLTRNDADREREMALIRQAIDRAAREGVRCLSVGHRKDPTLSTRDNLLLFKQVYGDLARYAEQRGVRLVFENWPNQGRNLAITPEAWDHMFNAVPSPALGLVMDPSHLVWQGIDYLQAVHDFGERIYHAHAKDTEILADGRYRYGIYGRQLDDEGLWWRYRLPGFGLVNWPAFIDALYQVGFDGVIAVEHEDPVWGWQTDPERAKRGLLLARQVLAPLLV